MPIPSGAPSGLLPSLLASGFPFHTAIAKLIQQTKHWKVTNEEFPWRDGDGAEHFLDITAATPLMVAAIECKKTRADVLTFLNPNRSNTTTHVRCTFIMQIQDSTKRMERFCTDWEMSPASYEAMFCVVSTSASGKDQRMLERDAHLLVAATDSYGSYHGMRYKPEFGNIEIPYLPILVTNSKLYTASYDPTKLNLEAGELPPVELDVKAISYARFTKSFASKHDLGARTVFVVNAGSLVEFLDTLDCISSPELINKVGVPF